MIRVEHIKADFVELIPSTLQTGILYVSRKYQTATHLCCCGCGSKVVTPLKPGGWKLTTKRGTVTLFPSIGSWSLPCKSHYWIRENSIDWAPQWSPKQIDQGRISDRLAREDYFDGLHRAKENFWQKLLKRILNAISR